MGLRMLTKTSDKTKFVEIIRGKQIHVKRETPGPIHLDGEPQPEGIDIVVTVIPASLKVVAGSGYGIGA